MCQLQADRDRDQGFVLVVVLLALGLIAVLALTFTASVRSTLNGADAVSAGARAEALADAGVALAVRDLIASREDRTRNRRYPPGAAPVACAALPGTRLAITIRDEAGRIDLNAASGATVTALLRGLGESESRAALLADRLLDFRDADDERRPQGAEAADYAALDLPAGPKNRPLDAIDELTRIPGMDPALLDRMRPYVTVHSGQSAIDVKAAPEGLVAALRAGGLSPERITAASPERVYAVRVEAETSDGARFVREAVVDLGLRRGPGHTFKRWYRGGAVLHLDALRAAGAPQPPC